jgi:hypothetical protein
MLISRKATILAVCLSLCACGESDDEELLDAGTMGPRGDSGLPRPDGGQATADAATTPVTDSGAQAPQVAGEGPEDGGGDGAVIPPDAGPAATTFTRVYSIITDRCAPCHTQNATPSGGLDMRSQASAYSELVGKAAEGGACSQGGGRTRVVAGNPDGSLLIRKLKGTHDCGNRMPAGGNTALSSALIDEIADWIEAGAEND